MKLSSCWLLVVSCLLLSACGHSLRDVYVRDGVVREYTAGHVGFSSAEMISAHDSEHMRTCMAELGSMPDDEQIGLCVEEARANQARNRRSRDYKAAPYYYYGYPPAYVRP